MTQDFDAFGRGYWLCPDLDKKKDSGDESSTVDTEKRDPVVKADANLVSSLCVDGRHRPVLDLDVPARYVPSTTPGHDHLYIDLPAGLTWEQYEAVLVALGNAGILEPGYVSAARRRHATFVRPQGVKKPAKEAPATAPVAASTFGKVAMSKTLNPPAAAKPPCPPLELDEWW